MINAVGYTEFSELNSSGGVYLVQDRVVFDGRYIYLGYHVANGTTNYLIKYDTEEHTYSYKIIGSGCTTMTTTLIYDDKHIIVSCVKENYTQIYIAVIDKDTLNLIKGSTFNTNIPSGDWSSAMYSAKRSDGNLTIVIYAKNNVNGSTRNNYVMLFNVDDISTGSLSLTDTFLLGVMGAITKLSDGTYIYHPAQFNASNMDFIFKTKDDTFKTWQYYDGTNVTIPVTPSNVDLSKKNSNLYVVSFGNSQKTMVDDKIYIGGQANSSEAGFEIHNSDLSLISTKTIPSMVKSYFYGVTDKLITTDSNGKLYLYNLDNGQANQFEKLVLYYLYSVKIVISGGYIYMAVSQVDGSTRTGAIAYYKTSDVDIVPATNKKLYPFWLGR